MQISLKAIIDVLIFLPAMVKESYVGLQVAIGGRTADKGSVLRPIEGISQIRRLR